MIAAFWFATSTALALELILFLLPIPFVYGPLHGMDEWIAPGRDQVPLLSFAPGLRVLFAVSGIAFCIRRRENLCQKLAALFASIFLAMLVSSSAKEAALTVLLWAPLLLVATAPEVHFRPLLRLFAICLALQMAVGLVLYAYQFDQFRSPSLGVRASGVCLTPNGYYPLCFNALFLFLFASFRRTGSSAFLAWQIAGLSCLMLLLTHSRVGLLSAGVALLVCGFVTRFSCKTLWALGTCLTVFAGVDRSSDGVLAALVGRGSLAGRAASVSEGWQVWKTDPLFGLGPHAFLHSSGYRALLEHSLRAPVEPKSFALYLGIDYGLPTIVAYYIAVILVVAALLTRLSRQFRCNTDLGLSRETFYWQFVFCSTLAVTIAGLFDASLFAGYEVAPATICQTFVWGLGLNRLRNYESIKSLNPHL